MAASIVTIMGLLIAAIFVWLWAMRATPLALGRVFSWTGRASDGVVVGVPSA